MALEKGECMVQQHNKVVYMLLNFAVMGLFRICLWHRLAARLIRLGVVRGVGRHSALRTLLVFHLQISKMF